MATDELTPRSRPSPTRRGGRSSARLAQGEASVNEIAEPFPISLQAVSKHLRSGARRPDLARRSAQQRPSRLRGAPLREAAGWLGTYRRFWEASFDRLGERLGERDPTMTEPATRTPRRDHDHARLRRAARAGLEGVDRAGALRRLVRRRRVRGAALEHLHGRQTRRLLASADVRGPRTRDPLEGRVSRGRGARAAGAHVLGSARGGRLRARHRRPRGPRRRPHGDALRAAWR